MAQLGERFIVGISDFGADYFLAIFWLDYVEICGEGVLVEEWPNLKRDLLYEFSGLSILRFVVKGC